MTFWEITLKLLEGLGYTTLIFGATLVVALPLGLILSFGSMSKFKPLSYAVKGLVWVIRGTPLMLQIIAFDLGPGLIGLFAVRTIPHHLIMVCVAFIVNYACYFSEIFRGGIESISQGQYEAAQTLGMSKKDVFFRVILLQVIKRVVPPMSNEIITLVKDTALASIVVHLDLFTLAKNIANTEVAIWPLFYAGLFYLLFNGVLSYVLRRVEKRLDYFKS